jgi:hypothetical protein
LKLLKEWIGKHNLKLNLLTRASQDGLNQKAFLERCGGKGPLLVVIKSKNHIFGGYSLGPWPKLKNTSEKDLDAFIYSINHKTKHIPFKNRDFCIGNSSCHYLMFGGDELHHGDLVISSESNTKMYSHSYLGKTYSLPIGI